MGTFQYSEATGKPETLVGIYRNALNVLHAILLRIMIKSFRSADTEKLHHRETAVRFRAIERVAQRKLRQLDAAVVLSDLASPPGNRLELLKGNRAGQHSVRVNDQWRICFRWDNGDAYDVEIVDYH